MKASTNSDLALLATSGIRRFSALAAKVDGCVRLTLGEPEFPTPPPVCEAVARSLAKGQTHYPPNNGRPELLEALSAYMRRHGLDYGPEELVVTCGATEALSATLMAILDPGDEVVVPTPAFGLYETIVRAAHGRVATLDTSCSGFQIRERDLRGVVGLRTRAIVITSPNNPTGCVLDSESLDAVADVAAERGLVVVCDDVYNRLCYEEGYERFAPRHPELRDQTVVVDSFSKPWAITGWRLGWLAAAPALKSQIQKMHQYLVSSVPSWRLAATLSPCVRPIAAGATTWSVAWSRWGCRSRGLRAPSTPFRTCAALGWAPRSSASASYGRRASRACLAPALGPRAS